MHTDKTLVITNRKKWIYYVSNIYDGKEHDFTILKKEFPCNIKWFKKFTVRVDLGFQGIAKKYACKNLFIPFKKPRKSEDNPNPELSNEEKSWNYLISRIRIKVEHSIGGMKRFNIINYKNRMKCEKKKNRIIGVCAALWNYKLFLKTSH